MKINPNRNPRTCRASWGRGASLSRRRPKSTDSGHSIPASLAVLMARLTVPRLQPAAAAASVDGWLMADSPIISRYLAIRCLLETKTAQPSLPCRNRFYGGAYRLRNRVILIHEVWSPRFTPCVHIGVEDPTHDLLLMGQSVMCRDEMYFAPRKINVHNHRSGAHAHTSARWRERGREAAASQMEL